MKWSHDDRAAQERLKRIGAEIALRRVREAGPHWQVAEAGDNARLGALREVAERQNAVLLATLKGIHDYCRRYQKTSRVAARVGELTTAALAGAGASGVP